MREEFFGYYGPSEKDYERLWKEGLVVLDTNVLLDLYRLPTSARNELITVLELLKDRIWIPYQVALEFQRRRLTVIGSERKFIEDALEDSKNLVEQVRARVNALQLDKRGLDLQPTPIIEEISLANDKLIDAIGTVHQAQLDISVRDPVRDRLDALLAGRVGHAPENQASLDLLIVEGEERYQNKIPPGFEDAEKGKNPNEAVYFHDGICYPKKFGDLIIWRQLIDHIRKSGAKSVILVTSDQKEDWWWRERGKTIGPRPELCREIRRESGIELFWMYSSVQFLQNAKEFTAAVVSEKSLKELTEVSLARSENASQPARYGATSELHSVGKVQTKGERGSGAEAAVFNWLLSRFGNVSVSRGFPDFLLANASGVHGYEVKYLRIFQGIVFSPSTLNAILRGYVEVSEGRLDSFSLVIVAEAKELEMISYGESRARAVAQMRKMIKEYRTNEISIGFVDKGLDGRPFYNVVISASEEEAI